MERKTIYLVKYSLGEQEDYQEKVHSAYEREQDAETAQLEVYINIFSAMKLYRERKIEYSTNLGDKHVNNWYNFDIERNSVWVEDFDYYTKKQD